VVALGLIELQCVDEPVQDAIGHVPASGEKFPKIVVGVVRGAHDIHATSQTTT
jgi:hypothetical protein